MAGPAAGALALEAAVGWVAMDGRLVLCSAGFTGSLWTGFADSLGAGALPRDGRLAGFGDGFDFGVEAAGDGTLGEADAVVGVFGDLPSRAEGLDFAVDCTDAFVLTVRGRDVEGLGSSGLTWAEALRWKDPLGGVLPAKGFDEVVGAAFFVAGCFPAFVAVMSSNGAPFRTFPRSKAFSAFGLESAP